MSSASGELFYLKEKCALVIFTDFQQCLKEMKGMLYKPNYRMLVYRTRETEWILVLLFY